MTVEHQSPNRKPALIVRAIGKASEEGLRPGLIERIAGVALPAACGNTDDVHPVHGRPRRDRPFPAPATECPRAPPWRGGWPRGWSPFSACGCGKRSTRPTAHPAQCAGWLSRDGHRSVSPARSARPRRLTPRSIRQGGERSLSTSQSPRLRRNSSAMRICNETQLHQAARECRSIGYPAPQEKPATGVARRRRSRARAPAAGLPPIRHLRSQHRTYRSADRHLPLASGIQPRVREKGGPLRATLVKPVPRRPQRRKFLGRGDDANVHLWAALRLRGSSGHRFADPMTPEPGRHREHCATAVPRASGNQREDTQPPIAPVGFPVPAGAIASAANGHSRTTHLEAALRMPAGAPVKCRVPGVTGIYGQATCSLEKRWDLEYATLRTELSCHRRHAFSHSAKW